MVSNLPVDPASSNQIKQRYKSKFLVGHAGALINRHKGQQYLLEAAALLQGKCPNIHFLLLGQGEDEQWLKRMAGDLKNVEFCGFCENIGDYMAAFDLFVFPSLQEGLGSVLLDAMQFKLPIIASAVDGILDIIVHGETGILIPPGDSHALYQSIKSLHDHRERREQLGEKAFAASQTYQPNAIAERYLQIYKGMVCPYTGPKKEKLYS